MIGGFFGGTGEAERGDVIGRIRDWELQDLRSCFKETLVISELIFLFSFFILTCDIMYFVQKCEGGSCSFG